MLFTAIAAILLAVIWGTTLNLAANEQAAAQRAGRARTKDVADTYEAQVVRALREVDQTLKLVRYRLTNAAAGAVLDNLRAEGLLPPALIFTVSVAGANGALIASTDPGAAEQVDWPALQQRAREGGGIVVGLPQRASQAGEWHLSFARGVQRTDGSKRSGIVGVTVHAGYFVSGYEPDALGEQGVLGLVGTDGAFRARRTGDEVSAGTRIDYAALGSVEDAGEAKPRLTRNPWDDVRRYTIARKIFGYPLAIVVGLSQREQLAAADRLKRTYLWRAGAASVLVIAVIALLGRLSWQLHKTRNRMLEERMAHAQRIEHIAFHDNLTDLPNRALFNRLLTQQMEQGKRYGKRLALLFLDLDGFKSINDSLGHDAGDELLQEIARRLTASIRKSDIVARLGGDEFVLVLPELSSGADAEPVALKVLDAASQPVTLQGRELAITASVGIAIFPEDGQSEESLLKNADIAMYQAKQSGKNNYRFYSDQPLASNPTRHPRQQNAK